MRQTTFVFILMLLSFLAGVHVGGLGSNQPPPSGVEPVRPHLKAAQPVYK